MNSPTAIVAEDLDRIDLSEADHFENGPPHEIFRRLRAESGLHRNRSREEADFWSLVRYDEINQVVKDPETFSSARPIAFMHDEKSIIPIEVLQGMMINMDPPAHSRYRKIVARAFTPAAMASYVPQLQALCTAEHMVVPDSRRTEKLVELTVVATWHVVDGIHRLS